MADAWVVFGAAIGGAFAGGAASTIGSLVTHRRMVTRNARVELLELLPEFRTADAPLTPGGGQPDRPPYQVLSVMKRRAATAGNGDRELVAELVDAWVEWHAAYLPTDEEEFDAGAVADEQLTAYKRYTKAVESLDQFLKVRVRKWF